jgi:integrase
MKPGSMRREICDGGSKSLYLHVQPSGAKSWVMLITRPNGKPGKLWLGPVDLSGREASGAPVLGTPLTLAGARWLTAEVHRQRAAGRDVIADRRAEKETQRARTEEPDGKFAAVAQQFIDEHARPKTRRWLETAHYLGLAYKEGKPARIRGGLAERWRDKEVTSITSDDVYRVVDETRRYGIPGLKRRVDGISDSRGRGMARVLSKLFGWALQHRKIAANPSIGVFVPVAPKSRERVLTDAEIFRFWRATDKINDPFGAMLKLLLLTGARLREVAGMRRAELSEDGTIWVIPGARTKNNRDHAVPMSLLAREILAGVKTVAGGPGYVFSTTGLTPVSGFSKTKRRLDELMSAAAKRDGVEFIPWRLHDLRRTYATGMAESPPSGLGIPPHIVEACLNHVSGHKVGVAGVYNKAEYLPEKRVALERWAAHVEALVERFSAAA